MKHFCGKVRGWETVKGRMEADGHKEIRRETARQQISERKRSGRRAKTTEWEI